MCRDCKTAAPSDGGAVNPGEEETAAGGATRL